MLSILREHIHDGRFLRLIETLLTSRIFGGLALPCHRERKPARGYSQPNACRISTWTNWTRLSKPSFFQPTPAEPDDESTHPMGHLQARASRLRKAGHWEEVQPCVVRCSNFLLLTQPTLDYRRMHYLRYADDWLDGIQWATQRSRGNQATDEESFCRRRSSSPFPNPRRSLPMRERKQRNSSAMKLWSSTTITNMTGVDTAVSMDKLV